jgi:hypothetical protein
MPIEKPRYPTDALIGTFERDNPNDMAQLNMVKDMVSRFNDWLKQSDSDIRYRVCLRGREPYKKMIAEPGAYVPGSKGPVKYNYHGNIVGGIENASVLKAYIYRRYPKVTYGVQS